MSRQYNTVWQQQQQQNHFGVVENTQRKRRRKTKNGNNVALHVMEQNRKKVLQERRLNTHFSDSRKSAERNE